MHDMYASPLPAGVISAGNATDAIRQRYLKVIDLTLRPIRVRGVDAHFDGIRLCSNLEPEVNFCRRAANFEGPRLDRRSGGPHELGERDLEVDLEPF